MALNPRVVHTTLHVMLCVWLGSASTSLRAREPADMSPVTPTAGFSEVDREIEPDPPRADDPHAAKADLSVTSDELRQHVAFLAHNEREGRMAGSQGGREAGDYLIDALKSYGLEGAGNDAFAQCFADQYRNILGVIHGDDPKLRDQFILLGAHYDHIGFRKARQGEVPRICNGADDNASGTAALLELAEAFAFAPLRPRRSILFAFWDAEERGLVGSTHYVFCEPTVPLEHIRLVINLDMIGRLRDNQLTAFASRSAPGLRQAISRANVESALRIEFSHRLFPCSDHGPFLTQEVPAVFFFTGFHESYHKPSDDTDTLNYQGLQRITRMLYRLVRHWADADEVPSFRERCETEQDADAWKAEIQKRRRPPLRLGISWKSVPDARQGDSPGPAGIRVTGVKPNSAAEKADIKPDDVITHVGGEPIENDAQLSEAVLRADGQLSLTTVRPGRSPPKKEITVSFDRSPLCHGMTLWSDDAEPEAWIVGYVQPDSPADHANIDPGDRIYRLNDHPVPPAEKDAPSSSPRLGSSLRKMREPIRLEVEREGQLRQLTLTP